MRGAGWKTRFARALAGLAVALAPGCGAPPAPRDAIVFVLVDTLRRDHVGFYGYERDTTPTLDALARSGAAFDAVAQSPWTAPSMASLWSSRLPSATGLRSREDERGFRDLKKRQPTRMATGHTTLAEALAGAGWVTLAAVSNVYASQKFGLLRGFERFDSRGRDASGMVDRALALLDAVTRERSGAPVFLYVHFIDLHAPTDPPEPWATRFPTSDGAAHEKRHQRWAYGQAAEAEGPAFEAFREHKIALYDGALAYVDAQIARLRDELAARGVAQPHWVIAADHGEELWDHRELVRARPELPQSVVGHGHSMFRELLDVPLIVAGPGVPALRGQHPVRNLDVAPTVLALAGVDGARFGFTGVDLLSAAERARSAPRPAFSEDIHRGYEAKALADGSLRYIRHVGLPGQPELLFDAASDPHQTTDLAPREPERAAALRAQLDAAFAGAPAESGAPAQLDPEDEERLRALGYLE